jgi:hypothetical protein
MKHRLAAPLSKSLALYGLKIAIFCQFIHPPGLYNENSSFPVGPSHARREKMRKWNVCM